MRNTAPQRRLRARSDRTARMARIARLRRSSRVTGAASSGCSATLRHHARMSGVALPFTAVTAYVNTIRAEEETPLPGSQEIERRIKSLVRWNAMAMVVRANRAVGRHRRPHLDLRVRGDALRSGVQPLLPRQGTRRRRRHHLLPGPRVARHLRARVPRRPAAGREAAATSARSCAPGGGLSSYPHPWLMPDFWEFPTVSMGLGPIMSIYQARFNRYLEDRGLKKPLDQQGVGVPRRRRDRRAGVARRDQPGGAREARQPDLRHQLQPAAARRPGPRQRPDHPGARGDLPRRRLERHQGDLGQRLGSAARRATTTACSRSGWAKSSTASIRNTPSSPAPISASTSSAPIRGCSTWSSTCPTIS